MMKYLDGFFKPFPKTTFHYHVRVTVITEKHSFQWFSLKTEWVKTFTLRLICLTLSHRPTSKPKVLGTELSHLELFHVVGKAKWYWRTKRHQISKTYFCYKNNCNKTMQKKTILTPYVQEYLSLFMINEKIYLITCLNLDYCDRKLWTEQFKWQTCISLVARKSRSRWRLIWCLVRAPFLAYRQPPPPVCSCGLSLVLAHEKKVLLSISPLIRPLLPS